MNPKDKDVTLFADKGSKNMRTDTVDAVFGNYWDVPKDSGFSSKYVSRIKKFRATDEDFCDYNTLNCHSTDYSSTTLSKNEGELPTLESSILEKFPTMTKIFSGIQPKKWIIDYSKINHEETNLFERRKYTKKQPDVCEENDAPYDKIQYMWLSDTKCSRKTGSRADCNKESLLEDPNETSPIAINFPHPVQLQNTSLPLEILDPRSVPCGTFVWWDRRVWEYNFVQMAKRLSTNQKKVGKRPRIETNSGKKR